MRDTPSSWSSGPPCPLPLLCGASFRRKKLMVAPLGARRGPPARRRLAPSRLLRASLARSWSPHRLAGPPRTARRRRRDLHPVLELPRQRPVGALDHLLALLQPLEDLHLALRRQAGHDLALFHLAVAHHEH